MIIDTYQNSILIFFIGKHVCVLAVSDTYPANPYAVRIAGNIGGN